VSVIWDKNLESCSYNMAQAVGKSVRVLDGTSFALINMTNEFLCLAGLPVSYQYSMISRG